MVRSVLFLALVATVAEANQYASAGATTAMSTCQEHEGAITPMASPIDTCADITITMTATVTANGSDNASSLQTPPSCGGSGCLVPTGSGTRTYVPDIFVSMALMASTIAGYGLLLA